ncbi:MAG: cysteine desulfurase family protein [Chitinophagales bacterium]
MIYLDYNATTPIDSEVLDDMLPFLKDKFGNASSITHQAGWLAKDGVETAIEQICSLLHCDSKEIVFTSGATESINMAIKGVFEIYKRKGNHIITCKTEHKAVLDVCASIEKKGGRVSYLNVDKNGLVDLEQLKKEISDQTILVSIMYVNNETGVIQPIDEIAKIVHEHNSIFMSDATQAVGKLPIDLENDRIDLMAFSAHKFYGPKGVGGLYIRRKKPRVILSPLIEGGGHQRGLRSGTLNVPGIVGLGAACELANKEMQANEEKVRRLRNLLESKFSFLPDVMFNGSGTNRLYNVSNICFKGVSSEQIINAVKSKVALSTGSACTSENQQPSHVLTAMGLSPSESHASLRFSLGKYTTELEIDDTAHLIIEKVKSVRSS